MKCHVESSWSSLLDRARHDDRTALGKLLERYRDYLGILVRLRLDDRLRAKVSKSDIIQQSLLEAVRDFHNYRGSTETELAGWLRSIVARNLADTVRMYCQTRQRNVRLEQSLEQDLNASSAALDCAFISPTSSPSQRAAQRERAVMLSDALAKLPEQYREVVIRRHFEGKSFSLIAREMGRSLDSVKNLWFRAFDQLRRLLREST